MAYGSCGLMYDVTCDKCNFRFVLTAVDIKESVVTIDGCNIRLVYLVCPKCTNIYRVSLKDNRYDRLCRDLDIANLKLHRAKEGRCSRSVLSRRYKDISRKAERLKSYTRELNERFSGTFTFLASGNKQEDDILYLP